jgi:hypothetical protein
MSVKLKYGQRVTDEVNNFTGVVDCISANGMLAGVNISHPTRDSGLRRVLEGTNEDIVGQINDNSTLILIQKNRDTDAWRYMDEDGDCCDVETPRGASIVGTNMQSFIVADEDNEPQGDESASVRMSELDSLIARQGDELKIYLRLYYESGKRIMQIKLPAKIERMFATPTARSSQTWKDKNGQGVPFYSSDIPIVRTLQNRHPYSLASFGETEFNLTNFSILRAKGVAEGIDWDVSSLRIIDADFMKWCKNVYKYIYAVLGRQQSGSADANPFILDVTMKSLRPEPTRD